MDIHKDRLGETASLDVWEQFVGGDVTCFKKLFKTYYSRMYGYGIKLCHKPEMVKDCIQELFKTVWERRGELGHIDSPRVYLFVSLRRKILNELEKQRKADGDLQEIDEQAFLCFGMEEIIIADERKHQRKEALCKALNQLSDRQKEVIYLHFYKGMSYGEIEKILSVNRQSVYNYMHRAIDTLRTLLDDETMKLVVSIMVFFLFIFNYF